MKLHDELLVCVIFKEVYSRGINLKEDNNIKFGYTTPSNIFNNPSETFISMADYKITIKLQHIGQTLNCLFPAAFSLRI